MLASGDAEKMDCMSSVERDEKGLGEGTACVVGSGSGLSMIVQSRYYTLIKEH